jgi:hypothetical protein
MQRWNPYQPPEDGLPPKEVRITELSAEPWPDGHRVRVNLVLTPFLERPNIEVIITGEDQLEAAAIHIIETIDERMNFTMHLRSKEPRGTYTLTASLNYPDHGTVFQDSVTFTMNE